MQTGASSVVPAGMERSDCMAVIHVTPGAGDISNVLGEVTTLKLRNAAFTMLESSAGHGEGWPPHAHTDQDEAIYVLSGSYRLSSGDEQLSLEAGAAAFIPRGTVHSLTAVGDEAARCLLVFNPPGTMERFLDEVRLAPEGEDALTLARRSGLLLLTSPV
jgi:quercetin dioxygenase-like cupin family protein